MAKAKADTGDPNVVTPTSTADAPDPVASADPVTAPADTAPVVTPIIDQPDAPTPDVSDPVADPAEPEPAPEPPPDPLIVATLAARSARLAATVAELAVLDAERIFDGLLPAATSIALNGRIHSVEEIERGYSLATEAQAKRQATRQTLIAAWEAQDKAETEVLTLEHAALLEARRDYDLSRPTA